MIVGDIKAKQTTCRFSRRFIIFLRGSLLVTSNIVYTLSVEILLDKPIFPSFPMHKILNHSNAGTIPTEAIDEVARYLEALVEVSFRLVCERVSIQEFQDVCIGTEYLLPLVRCDKVVHVLITSVYCHQGIRRFFSTWRTSLIGPHLSTLEAISRNVELRSLVKNILIENDCDRNDPWNTTEHLQSDNTWSRDDI